MTVLKRAWIPLLIVALAAVAGLTVSRVRNFFGADPVLVAPTVFANDPEPYNPKVVRLEVFGSGETAMISYLDLDSNPVKIDSTTLPWSITLTTVDTSAAPTVMAQGDGEFIGCRITVDDVVKSERTTSQMDAFTFCFVKSA